MFKVQSMTLLKNPKNASTRLSMNGKSSSDFNSPPFVLRFSKDEKSVFQKKQIIKHAKTHGRISVEP